MRNFKMIKTTSALFMLLILNGCANTKSEKKEPLLEVYPTNMNDCAPVMDTEDYINIDCKRRSVNRLTDEVEYQEEPALVSMQGFSVMESNIRICKNLTPEEKTALTKMMDNAFRDIIIHNYDFNKNHEFKKEFELISKTLKGQYDHMIKENECKNIQKMAQKEITEKYKLK